MIIRFTKSNLIGSKIIEWATSGDYSHCIAIVGGNSYQAEMLKGVVKGTVAAGLANDYADMAIPLDYAQTDAAIQFLEAQVGKPYDWGGAVGLPFVKSTGWQDDSKWFCSELVYAALVAGGYIPFDLHYSKRISPQHLLMLNFSKYK